MTDLERYDETDDEYEHDKRLTIFNNRWGDVMGEKLTRDKIKHYIINNDYRPRTIRRSMNLYKGGYKYQVLERMRRNKYIDDGILLNTKKGKYNLEITYKDISPRQEKNYLKNNKEIELKTLDFNNYRLKNGFYSRDRNKTIKNYFKKLKVIEKNDYESREDFLNNYDGFYNLKKIVDVYGCDDVCCNFCGLNKKSYELNFVGNTYYDELRQED